MITDTELDNIIYGAYESMEKVPFQVTDLQSADWAVRKAKDAEARIAQRRELAAAYKAKVDAWLDDANRGDAETVEYMATILRPFVEKEIEGQRTRTVKLPSGDAGMRKLPDHIDIPSESMLIGFLDAAHPECLRVKKEVDKAALKKLITEIGNIYADDQTPMARIVPGEERLYIK